MHHTVVRKGDYEASEAIVTKAIEGRWSYEKLQGSVHFSPDTSYRAHVNMGAVGAIASVFW